MPRFKNDKEPITINKEISRMKDIKTINKRLDAIREKHDTQRKNLIEEKNKKAAEVAKNEAILKAPKDSADYIRAAENITKAKKEIEYLDIQLSQLDNNISKEDYNAALKELNDSLNTFVFENRETLKSEIDTLIKDYFDYYEGVREYNTALINLAILAGEDAERKFPDSELYKDETITGIPRRIFEFLHKEKSRIDYIDLLNVASGRKNEA